MPSVPTFIRDENFDVWRALKDYKEGRTQGGGQAAWLNEKLAEEKLKREEQADRQISMSAPHLRPTPRKRPLDDVMALLEPTESKLSPEGVDAYEKASGFKTTGDVTVSVSSDKVHNLTKQLYEPKPFVPQPPDPEVGYPCCQSNQPCKHWHFDGVLGLWTNEITKKTREAV